MRYGVKLSNEFKIKEDGVQNKAWIQKFEMAINYVYQGHDNDMKKIITVNVVISDWISNQRSNRVTLVGRKDA